MTAARKTVAVLMGGWSVEREVSLMSGNAVLAALIESGYDARPVDVTRDLGRLLADLDPRPDVAFNALHGRGGEDGGIPSILDMLRIPYTHSGVLASATGMNKPAACRLVSQLGVRVAENIVVPPGRFHDTPMPFPPPYVVKPAEEGSSVGVHIVRAQGDHPVIEGWLLESTLMVERYIPGKELTVGIRGLAGEEATILGITEITPAHEFFDYDSKYTEGGAIHALPASVPDEIAAEAGRIAALAHTALGCSGISRTDFRWDDSQPGAGGLYFLEINTHPGFTRFSLVPEQAAYLGISFSALVSWLVEGARCHG